MRISQQTTDTLVLECREWGLFFLFAPLFVGMCWVMLLLSGEGAPFWVYPIFGMFPVILGLGTVLAPRRSQMVLNKSTGRLELRRKHMFGYRSRWFELAHVDLFYASQRFDVESATSEETPHGFLNVRIGGGMDTGNYSLNIGAKRIDRVRALADAVNLWRAA